MQQRSGPVRNVVLQIEGFGLLAFQAAVKGIRGIFGVRKTVQKNLKIIKKENEDLKNKLKQLKEETQTLNRKIDDLTEMLSEKD